jgi:hypothetical protein
LSEVPELNVDKSDRTPERLMIHKDVYNGVRHTGAYFGPGMDLGPEFHNIDKFTKEEICEQIKLGWPEWYNEKHHIVRCHQFINNFDFLVNTFPDSKFVVVTRRPEQCVAGWMSVGGIDIPYPHYKEHYKDNKTAADMIRAEAQLALEVIWDYQMDTYVASAGHFKRKWGLEITDEDSDLAKYIRSIEGYMYKQENPKAKLKFDVQLGYLNFD